MTNETKTQTWRIAKNCQIFPLSLICSVASTGIQAQPYVIIIIIIIDGFANTSSSMKMRKWYIGLMYHTNRILCFCKRDLQTRRNYHDFLWIKVHLVHLLCLWPWINFLTNGTCPARYYPAPTNNGITSSLQDVLFLHRVTLYTGLFIIHPFSFFPSRSSIYVIC